MRQIETDFDYPSDERFFQDWIPFLICFEIENN